MLHASEYFEAAGGAMATRRIKVTPELDLGAMHGPAQGCGRYLTGGIEFLFKKNKVDWPAGLGAQFTGKDSVEVAGKAYRAKNIIIATGSSVHSASGRRGRQRQGRDRRFYRRASNLRRCPVIWS